ncbi:hypothetical protein KCU65_g9063, partial [Aureobasidium melanogenum]
MPYTYKSIIPYDSPLLAVNNPIKIPKCIDCDEPLLDSKQIVVKCCDSCGHHKSQCVNCLLMELDDCCVEISSETISTISSLLESKISNDFVQAREKADLSIRYQLSDPSFNPTAAKSHNAPEDHHEHNLLSPDGRYCTHFDSEGLVLNDELLDFYLHEPEAPTTNFSAWEDLTVDQLPDYVDEDELSTPDSEIEIICSDLG